MASSDSTRIALKADPDDPEDFDVTEEALERALAERSERMRRAAETPATRPVMLLIDEDVMDKFRATGPGWQSRINEALRAASV